MHSRRLEIEYRVGDILTYDGKYIVQGVNTLGVMGAGLAKQIRDTYPKVWDVYRTKKLKLGDVFGVDCGKHIILNIATQAELGRYKKPFNYTAFTVGLDKINSSFSGPVAFPAIGCGLGGGDWYKVAEIMRKVCTNIQPIVYYLNDEIPWLTTAHEKVA